MRNQLSIVNLAQNAPQTIIDISPFRFIQFVKKGMQDHYGLCSDKESIVLFLAEDTRNRTVRMLGYKTKPWHMHDKPMKH
jgi:hypothetical protein